MAQGPIELLKDSDALGRWFIASGIVNSVEMKRLFRRWHGSPEAAAFLKELIAFRERLRDAILRIENGSTPSDDFIRELNAQLLEYRPPNVLRKRNGRIVRETLFDPQRIADLWTPFVDGAANLLTEIDTTRLRQCESCVVHFYDTSKKGSRRWCSMNLCGNKIKVAAYQRRKRHGDSR